MNKHLFKLFFGAMFLFAGVAFVGCNDDEPAPAPELEVSVPILNFVSDGATTQTVEVKANCEWKVKESGLEGWATVSPMSGKGNTTLSVSVSEQTSLLTGTISFELIHPDFGKWGMADATVKVNYTVQGMEMPSDEVIFYNNFDKEAIGGDKPASGWPWCDSSDAWKNQTGTGAADVTYATKSMSVRGNSESNSKYSLYSSQASGQNNLVFGNAGSFITVEKIAVSNTNLKLSFGTERYLYGSESNIFNHDELKVELSADGSAWSAPLTDAFQSGSDPDGMWDLAVADFTLPEGTLTLYVRFTCTLNGSSAIRLDDVKLMEGFGGQKVTFDGSSTPDNPDNPTPTPGDAIYFNDFDKELIGGDKPTEGWPWCDKTEAWKNHSGTGASAVTYDISSVSVRGNSASDSKYSLYPDLASGGNNLVFGNANSYVTIEKIAVESLNLQLSFGTERYLYGSESNIFNHDELKVELSADGSAWSAPLTYAFQSGSDPDGMWDLAVADFTLPEGTSTLYVRYTCTLEGSSAIRLDDVKLVAGNGGQKVTFDGSTAPDPDPEPTPGESVTMTIPQLVAACKGTNKQVVNAEKDVVFEAVVVTDKDGGNWSDNNLAVMTEGATAPENGILIFGSGVTDPGDDNYNLKAGDKIKVTLKAGLAMYIDYQGCYELTGNKGDQWVAVEKIGTATVTPVEITCDKLAQYQYMPVVLKNVTSPATAAAWSGSQTFTQNGTSFTVYTASKAVWVDDKFKPATSGDIVGMVTLYKGAAQLAPRNEKDIQAFMEAAVTPDPDPDPDTPSGDVLASLSADDVVALVATLSNSYADFSTKGWTGHANQANAATDGKKYLGLTNDRAGKEASKKSAHVKTPEYSSNIKKVTVEYYTASSKDRKVDLYAGDVDVTKELNSVTAVAEGTASTAAGFYTCNYDLTGKNLKQVVIYASKGALSIKSVTVELE